MMTLFTSLTLGQEKVLPRELNQTSSLSEILGWLDKTSFANASVGLKTIVSDAGLDPADRLTAKLSESAFFSPGFRLIKVDGCNLTLRNDNVKVLSFLTSSYNPDEVASLPGYRNGKRQSAALLFIPLDKMSDRKGKGPYRHTKDPEKVKLLGVWRTEFKKKGFFSREIFRIDMIPSEQGATKESMEAQILTFTFEKKEMSEQFNAAFRQAIKLCTAK
jgi:hypothetical protein